MILNLSIIFIISFILATITFIVQYSHFLISLFCLEAIILTSTLLITIISCRIRIYIPHLIIILLTMGACEARIGLSLIVIISRTSGSDMMSNMSIIKC